MILPCLSYAGLQVCMDSHWTPQNLSTLIRTRTNYKLQIKTAVAYFHHDKIGGKSVGSGMVRPSPPTTSGHWCGRPAHDAVPGSTLDLSLWGQYTNYKLQYLGEHLMIFHCYIIFLPRLSTFPQTEDIWGCFSPVRLLPQCRTPVARPYKQRNNDCA